MHLLDSYSRGEGYSYRQGGIHKYERVNLCNSCLCVTRLYYLLCVHECMHPFICMTINISMNLCIYVCTYVLQ